MFQNLILSDALPRGIWVRYRVSSAAVKEAVISAGGPGCEIPFFNQNAWNSSEPEISRDPNARCAAPNDQDLCFEFHVRPKGMTCGGVSTQ